MSVEIPDSVTSIGDGAFHNFDTLESIEIGVNITSIEGFAFLLCENLTVINFDGTTEEWKAIEKGSYWNSSPGKYTVYCKDGTVAKNGTVTLNP